MTTAPAAEARSIRDGELPLVLDLYKAHKKTLGFLPDGAFEEFAQEGRILVVKEGESLRGYLAYRVAAGDAAIVYLCVRAEERGRGVVRALLNRLFVDTADLDHIRLSCREEYEANKTWPRFGFTCLNERAGRGQDGARLLLWVRRVRSEEPPLLAGAGTREQVRRYRALLGLDRKEEGEVVAAPDVRKQARHRGLAQHLAHARGLQGLVESGRFSSIRALAKHHGLSGTRVSQLLGLLDLAPEILAAIEAAGVEELGVTEKELRRIARMEERVQLREWKKCPTRTMAR